MHETNFEHLFISGNVKMLKELLYSARSTSSLSRSARCSPTSDAKQEHDHPSFTHGLTPQPSDDYERSGRTRADQSGPGWTSADQNRDRADQNRDRTDAGRPAVQRSQAAETAVSCPTGRPGCTPQRTSTPGQIRFRSASSARPSRPRIVPFRSAL